MVHARDAVAPGNGVPLIADPRRDRRWCIGFRREQRQAAGLGERRGVDEERCARERPAESHAKRHGPARERPRAGRLTHPDRSVLHCTMIGR